MGRIRWKTVPIDDAMAEILTILEAIAPAFANIAKIAERAMEEQRGVLPQYVDSPLRWLKSHADGTIRGFQNDVAGVRRSLPKDAIKAERIAQQTAMFTLPFAKKNGEQKIYGNFRPEEDWRKYPNWSVKPQARGEQLIMASVVHGADTRRSLALTDAEKEQEIRAAWGDNRMPQPAGDDLEDDPDFYDDEDE